MKDLRTEDLWSLIDRYVNGYGMDDSPDLSIGALTAIVTAMALSSESMAAAAAQIVIGPGSELVGVGATAQITASAQQQPKQRNG